MREYTQRAIALGGAANLFRDVVVLEGVVVCEHAAGAVLLGAILAVGADAAAVHHAPNAHSSTNGKVFDVRPHRNNSADYLVTRHHRELRGTPVLLTWWMSVWQMPLNMISMATSLLPGARRVIV